MPANTPHIRSFFLAVLTILLAEPGAGVRASFGRRAAALGCALAAGFSLAVGLVLWPVLAFMAWRGGRADRPWFAVVVGVGAVFTAAYAYGQSVTGSGDGFSLRSLFMTVEYFIAYLGLPWVRASDVGGRLAGLLLFSLALTAVLRSPRPASRRTDQVAAGLILFTLGTAALAAMGRHDVNPIVDVPVRYNILTAPLKVGLLLFFLPWLDAQWRARRQVLQMVWVAGFCALIVQQVLIGSVAAKAAERTRTTFAQFEQGLRTPIMTQIIHPDLPHAERIWKEMKRRGVYQD